jgi:hypothetical protein
MVFIHHLSELVLVIIVSHVRKEIRCKPCGCNWRRDEGDETMVLAKDRTCELPCVIARIDGIDGGICDLSNGTAVVAC